MKWGAWVPLIRTQSFSCFHSLSLSSLASSGSPLVYPKKGARDRVAKHFCSFRMGWPDRQRHPCHCDSSLLCQSHHLLPTGGLHPERTLPLDMCLPNVHQQASPACYMWQRTCTSAWCSLTVRMSPVLSWHGILKKHPFLKFNELSSFWGLLSWGPDSYLLFV